MYLKDIKAKKIKDFLILITQIIVFGVEILISRLLKVSF
jgi:hypothetical protein